MRMIVDFFAVTNFTSHRLSTGKSCHSDVELCKSRKREKKLKFGELEALRV